MSGQESSIKIGHGPLYKQIDVPTSKSYINRLLILGSLSKKEITIHNVSYSLDVLNLINSLVLAGVEIVCRESTVHILNSFPQCEKATTDSIVLKTGDGGTTNRFLLPFLARGKKEYLLQYSGHLSDRPFDELINALKDLKLSRIERDKQKGHYKVQGPIEFPESLTISCKRSTQFASALLMALMGKNTKVIINNLESSHKYLFLTQKLLDDFSCGKTVFTAPPDFSSMSCPLALGLLTGEAVIVNVEYTDHLQADSEIVQIVKKIGGQIDLGPLGLTVKKSNNLSNLNIDCSSFPDLVPALAFLASYIPGENILKGLDNLRYKETNRVAELIKILRIFEVSYHYDQNEGLLKIFGNRERKVGYKIYDAPCDHRMIMTAWCFMRINAGGEIRNYHHVDKSFPSFFKVLE